MTAKRDLEKGVRARQAQAGESYMTALRHEATRLLERLHASS
jgi:hypothetical protein